MSSTPAGGKAARSKPEKRRNTRTKRHGPQKLEVSFQDLSAGEKSCQAVLWDFSEGGLGMDSPRSFEPGEIVGIEASLRNKDMAMFLKAKARVAYCRKVDGNSYRVGVGFIEVSFRRLE